MPSWRTLRGATAGNVDKGPTTVEITFATAAYSKSFTITDANVAATNTVFAQHSMAAATSKSQDENEGDALVCRTVAGAGSFTLYVDAIPGPVLGAFKITYEVR